MGQRGRRPPGSLWLCGGANRKVPGAGDASATLLANELLARAAERASAGGRWRRRSCRRRGRRRNTGVLAGHCERVAVDLTRERRRVQNWRRDGTRIHCFFDRLADFGPNAAKPKTTRAASTMRVIGLLLAMPPVGTIGPLWATTCANRYAGQARISIPACCSRVSSCRNGPPQPL